MAKLGLIDALRRGCCSRNGKGSKSTSTLAQGATQEQFKSEDQELEGTILDAIGSLDRKKGFNSDVLSIKFRESDGVYFPVTYLRDSNSDSDLVTIVAQRFLGGENVLQIDITTGKAYMSTRPGRWEENWDAGVKEIDDCEDDHKCRLFIAKCMSIVSLVDSQNKEQDADGSSGHEGKPSSTPEQELLRQFQLVEMKPNNHFETGKISCCLDFCTLFNR